MVVWNFWKPKSELANSEVGVYNLRYLRIFAMLNSAAAAVTFGVALTQFARNRTPIKRTGVIVERRHGTCVTRWWAR